MELALQLIAEAKRTRATRLDLGNCGLTELPEQLFELVWLEELNLSSGYNPFETYVSKEIIISRGLSNKIESISEKINLLKHLKKLDISYSTFSDLNILTDLQSLEILNFGHTDVIDLSPLKVLKNLRKISAYFTKIKDLTPIENLGKLEYLSIFSTPINNLSPLENLNNLQFIEIHLTEVRDLNPVKKLKKLKTLIAYCTPIEDLTPIKNLISLTELNIHSTPVTDFNTLGMLVNLEKLTIPNTQIEDLSPLKKLKKLEYLNVHTTQISDLSPLENLPKLKHLSITNTKVNNLNPLKNFIENGLEVKWQDFNDEDGIYVNDCPLEKPLKAAIRKGHSAVLKYLKKPKLRLFEARIMILGEPRAGKTTLRNKLKDPNCEMPKETESTKAFEIEIEPYRCTIDFEGEKQKMTYNLWDFGGQEYYRLLHQLFVSEQSVYVIVTDTDRNKNEEELDFWLETIQRQGRDRQGKYGPVILFQNPKSQRDGNAFADLQKRYPFWQQTERFVINLNALDEKAPTFDRRELERFRQFKAYLEASFAQLDHIGKEMPTQWIALRKALAKHEKDNWITVEQFNRICTQKGIPSDGEQADLLDIFHTLGYLLHYDTAALRGMVILNREWATDALYRVLDAPLVERNKGWFRRDNAQEIWHEAHYRNRTEELLALMQEFKLSYENKTAQKYIVPAKLPDHTEGMPDWDAAQNVRLHLQYDWLPRAVPTQLIVSLHEYLVEINAEGEQWIWRRGGVLDGKLLELSDTQVKIEDNWRQNRIEISARGTHSEMLIRQVMKDWRQVNEPFVDKVKVDKIILCGCDQCAKATQPHIFKYDNVLKALDLKRNLQCNESFEEFSAADILRGVFDETTTKLDGFLRKGGRISDEVKELLSDGKLDLALDKFSKEDVHILGLKSRFSDILRQLDKATISPTDFNVEKNRLVESLLNYLQDDTYRLFRGR